MSFWNKASELAAERLKQGREQIANFQRQSSTPPRPPGKSSGVRSTKVLKRAQQSAVSLTNVSYLLCMQKLRLKPLQGLLNALTVTHTPKAMQEW